MISLRTLAVRASLLWTRTGSSRLPCVARAFSVRNGPQSGQGNTNTYTKTSSYSYTNTNGMHMFLFSSQANSGHRQARVIIVNEILQARVLMAKVEPGSRERIDGRKEAELATENNCVMSVMLVIQPMYCKRWRKPALLPDPWAWSRPARRYIG
jgi:hypothetical protein